ncbi:hypothetical protein GGQ84_000180 [Desulfitispora alkaliphila]|uniref:hypothetical protein n=1 Tax=Desulfitispora alkaliphila TaxID=622674 RepID=UPI003D21B9B7
MKIALVVEGQSDRIFFSSLIDYFKNYGVSIDIIDTGGRPSMFKNAEKHYKACKYGLGADFVIFMPDIDNDVSVDITAEKVKVCSGDNYKVSVIVRELEAWILADGNCINQVLDSDYQPSGITDNIVNPKEKLTHMIYDKLNLKLTAFEIAQKFSPHFSVFRAEQNNNSLNYFLQIIKGLSKENVAV